MKTLYIHIGMPKTGSNAVRDFCRKNKKVLEQKGCFYLGTSEEVFGNIYSEGDFHAGVQNICETFQNCNKILISDNEIWYSADKEPDGLWTGLMQTARREGFLVHVIGYLLQRDAFLYKFRERMDQDQEIYGKSFAEYMEIFQMSSRLVYYHRLDRISDIVGKECITVLGFQEKNLKSKELYEGFLKAAGLVLTEEYKLPDNVKNPGVWPDVSKEKKGSHDILQMHDDVIRFSGALAVHFYKEQKELEREIREVTSLRHPFVWMFRRIKKKMKWK